MFYEWKDIKGRKKEEKDRISIFIFYCFSQMNLLSYILCYFMLAYRVKAIIIITIGIFSLALIIMQPVDFPQRMMMSCDAPSQ